MKNLLLIFSIFSCGVFADCLAAEAIGAGDDTTILTEDTKCAIKAFEKEQWEEGFRLSKKADLKDKEIQFYLGVCHSLGRGTAKDECEAVKWFRKSAEQGNALGQAALGGCYLEGVGVVEDEKEAVKWFRKSAEQGGKINLCYLNNLGVVSNVFGEKEGSAIGQWLLGTCYAEGRGVAKDEREAVKWYRKAAEQGDATGQCLLGVCYQEGRGVAKDEREAVKWYRKAAEQGDATGQCGLGVCYEVGCGVAKDEAEAIKWYRKAAEQGDTNAKEALKRLGY